MFLLSIPATKMASRTAAAVTIRVVIVALLKGIEHPYMLTDLGFPMQ